MNNPHLVIAASEENTSRQLQRFAGERCIPFMVPFTRAIESFDIFMQGAGALIVSPRAFEQCPDPTAAIASIRGKTQHLLFISVLTTPRHTEKEEHDEWLSLGVDHTTSYVETMHHHDRQKSAEMRALFERIHHHLLSLVATPS